MLDELPGHGIDITRPNGARIYDYLLGGKDNFAADRHAAEQFKALYPDGLLEEIVTRNRVFLSRAVSWITHQGIRQFADLGAGLPLPSGTGPQRLRNIHETAREAARGTRVCYVDSDPVVVSHLQALACGEGITAVKQDLSVPAGVLGDPGFTSVIDLDRPAALILGMVAQLFPADLMRDVIAAYMARLDRGSFLVMSCPRWDDEVLFGRVAAAYESGRVWNHPEGTIEGFFGGMEVIPPGVKPARGWQAGWTDSLSPGGPAFALCGIGWKP